MRRLRPVVDGAMAVVLLLQMVPGKTGNALHEVFCLPFLVLGSVVDGAHDEVVDWAKGLV